jgi:prepilin-type N-terminal cleavage/methylation domain-containing protein
MSQLMKRVAKKGFTLIELMIVVAIIGILAAIAIPKFADLITKSRESATKGSLGSLRGAITIYYSDMEGVWPNSVTANSLDSLVTKYIEEIPSALSPKQTTSTNGNDGHDANPAVANAAGDTGGWVYYQSTGAVSVNCSHEDTKSVVWNTW